MNEPEEKPIPQQLRVVTVMDAIPGHAGEPVHGTPIGIVTLGHRGEVEQPLLLYLRDVRKLAVSLLTVLAHFGDETAEEIVEKHIDRLGAVPQTFTMSGVGDDTGSFTSPAHSKPPILPPPKSIPTTGLKMMVKFHDRKLVPMVLEVIGGYRWKKDIMLMYRCGQFGGPAVESLVKLLGGGMITFKGHKASELLPKQKWGSFCAIPPGRALRLGQRLWIKMTFNEIKGLVNRKVFRIAPDEPVEEVRGKHRVGELTKRRKVSESHESRRMRRSR